MEPQMLKAIYHEKQERGSMLCAQHALNNLFQEPVYQADDLATLARQLDKLEQDQLGNDHSGQSHNYDDSGFFSVGVLESALDVYGLRLVRWRSREILKAQHDQPEFYNLDSCAAEPQWISATMLGLTLYEAERAGYNVFVILPSDKARINGLPSCAADDVVRALPKASARMPLTSAASINGATIPTFSGAGSKLGTSSSKLSQTSSAPMTPAPQAGPSKMNGTSARHKRRRSATPLSIDSSDDEPGHVRYGHHLQTVAQEDDDDDVIVVGSFASSSRTTNGSQNRSRQNEQHSRKKRMTFDPDLTRDRYDSPTFLEPDVTRQANGTVVTNGIVDEDDAIAKAIAESLKMSRESTALQGDEQQGQSTEKERQDEELQRALKASLDLTNSGGDDDVENEEEEESEESRIGGDDDSPTMEELRRRRLARFGG
ncbi:hypothetical protein OIV83_005603 [Microbotryomycetes sp. JL201]|nr:hypothetical protein OIV83_005603 [Microbotryomycetes sp. JL201]